MSESLIELDERRRVSLGKIGRHSRYLVREEPDGTLVFEPAVVLTETERAYLANTDLASQIDETERILSVARRVLPVRRGSSVRRRESCHDAGGRLPGRSLTP